MGHLPATYRRNYVEFFRSRSLQGPYETDYENPRALLFSDKFIISFNGDPKQPGNLALEMAEIDKSGGKNDLNVIKYYEVEFPVHEDDVGNRSWQDIQSKIKYSSENPDKCKACHGDPARPIYPGYPIWDGSFASHHIDPQPPEELQGLQKYIDKVHGSKPSRYQQLTLGNYRPDMPLFDKYLNNNRMNHNVLNGILGEANEVRVARLAMKTPEYDKFKYALMGSFLRCDGFEDFLPKKTRTALLSNIENKFQLKTKWPPEKETGFINKIYLSDQLFLISDMGTYVKTPKEKITSEKYEKKFLQDLGGSEEFKRLQLDTFAIQNPVRADPLGADLRLIMEGRGINIDNWFLDLTQPTYRFHDGSNGAIPVIQELVKMDPTIDSSIAKYFRSERYPSDSEEKTLCKNLKNLSQKKLAGTNIQTIPPAKDTAVESQITTDNNRCGVKSKDITVQIKELREKNSQNLEVKYPPTFTSTCKVCHDSEAKIAPRIPFSSPAEMTAWLSKPENKALIKGKLLNPDETRRMPPTRKLSEQELSQILNFIGRQ